MFGCNVDDLYVQNGLYGCAALNRKIWCGQHGYAINFASKPMPPRTSRGGRSSTRSMLLHRMHVEVPLEEREWATLILGEDGDQASMARLIPSCIAPLELQP